MFDNPVVCLHGLEKTRAPHLRGLANSKNVALMMEHGFPGGRIWSNPDKVAKIDAGNNQWNRRMCGNADLGKARVV